MYAELVQWLAQKLYLGGGASKARSKILAEEIVQALVDKGYLKEPK